MSKRVANKKGQPSRNRAPERTRVRLKIQQAVRQGVIDAQRKAAIETEKRQQQQAAQPRPVPITRRFMRWFRGG